MECPNCEAKWELKDGSKLEQCPFCQYDFTAKQEKTYSADSVEGILQSIVSKYTVGIYEDSPRFKSILSDMMSKEAKTLKLLKLQIDQNVARTLYASRKKSEKEFEMARRKVIVDVADNLFSDEEKMEIGVNLLCVGLGKSVETVFGMVEESASVDTTAWTEVAKSWLKKAEVGDVDSQFELGNAYEKGTEGVALDLNLAFYWYQKGAENGNAKAQNYLGLCYEYGKGVAKDGQKAFYWYKKGAEGGNEGAQRNLGICYETGERVAKDLGKAFYWYEKSAEGGHVNGQNNLGLCYEHAKGVAKDLRKAFYWYEKSAQGGNMKAQNNLGLCYEYAKGVAKDLDKAFYWFEKSAEGGSIGGQTELALCYLYGTGVAKDKEKGRLLLKKSVDVGSQRAKEEYKKIFGFV